MLEESIWRICDHCEIGSYLFVIPEEKTISIVFTQTLSPKIELGYFGLWYHEISTIEIATTLACKRYNHSHRWLHEYYRVYGDWLHWYNPRADIQHYKIEKQEVPKNVLESHSKNIEKVNSLTRPLYSKNRVRVLDT